MLNNGVFFNGVTLELLRLILKKKSKSKCNWWVNAERKRGGLSQDLQWRLLQETVVVRETLLEQFKFHKPIALCSGSDQQSGQDRRFNDDGKEICDGGQGAQKGGIFPSEQLT